MLRKGAIIAAAARIICDELQWDEVEIQEARAEIERTWREHRQRCQCGISLDTHARLQIYEQVLPAIMAGEYVLTNQCQN